MNPFDCNGPEHIVASEVHRQRLEHDPAYRAQRRAAAERVAHTARELGRHRPDLHAGRAG